VQADTYSYPDVFLGEQLASAARNVTPKDERTKKLVAMTKDWNGIAAPDTSVVPFLELTRLEALRLILEPYLGTETDLYRWRKVAFLQRVLTERPAKWLPATYKSYDELIVAAADSAVRMLEERTKSTHIEDWQWKRFNALEMHHPIGRKGALKFFLSIADKAQAARRRSATARRCVSLRTRRIGTIQSCSLLAGKAANQAAAITAISFRTGSTENRSCSRSATRQKRARRATR